MKFDLSKNEEYNILIRLHVEQDNDLFSKVWVQIESNNIEAVDQVKEYLRKMPKVSHFVE